MLDVSTREFRYLMRLLTRSAVLWTEMVVDETLVHCHNPDMHLTLQDYRRGVGEQRENTPALLIEASPVVCQIGGNRPEYARAATRLVMDHGYDGIDLNCECPSHRVASSREFGAALMKKPDVAVQMVTAIHQALASSSSSESNDRDSDSHPKNNKMWLSVKMRIGVDDEDSWEYLSGFVNRLRPYCRRFVVHARKVYTQGLSPDQNRRIPPLNYQMVYRLCREFSDCEFILNGGIQTLRQAKALLFGSDALEESGDCDGIVNDDEPPTSQNLTASLRRPPDNLCGVMMGRAARDDPVQFWDADRYLQQDWASDNNRVEEAATPHFRVRNRRELLDAYCAYLERLYPRRCCDDDSRITSHFPSPVVVHTAPHCARCRPLSAPPAATGEKAVVVEEESSIAALQKRVDEESSGGSEAATDPLRGRRWRKLQQRAQHQHQSLLDSTNTGENHAAAGMIKVSSNVIDRSFRPVWGVLHGQPGSRRFRRALFEAGRDLVVRNCGPARILRDVVMSAIPEDVLDRPFEQPWERDKLFSQSQAPRACGDSLD
jgi:tRNA-dihydrouridine synthase A